MFPNGRSRFRWSARDILPAFVCGGAFQARLVSARKRPACLFPVLKNVKLCSKQSREFARSAQKIYLFIYTHRISSTEPIEKSALCRCRAVCPAQGVQRGDEIHPCASHGCECLSSQKRLLRGGCYAARSRTQGRGGQPGAESHNKKNSSLKKSPKADT